MTRIKPATGIARLDLALLFLTVAIAIMMLVPLLKKPDDVLIRQAHKTERYQLNTQIDLHSRDHEGMYPRSMKPKDWLQFEKYFPHLASPSLNVEVPLYCNQGTFWEINPDHTLSLLGHGNHE